MNLFGRRSTNKRRNTALGTNTAKKRKGTKNTSRNRTVANKKQTKISYSKQKKVKKVLNSDDDDDDDGDDDDDDDDFEDEAPKSRKRVPPGRSSRKLRSRKAVPIRAAPGWNEAVRHRV